jgi:hypothetical protein
VSVQDTITIELEQQIFLDAERLATQRGIPVSESLKQILIKITAAERDWCPRRKFVGYIWPQHLPGRLKPRVFTSAPAPIRVNFARTDRSRGFTPTNLPFAPTPR